MTSGAQLPPPSNRVPNHSPSILEGKEAIRPQEGSSMLQILPKGIVFEGESRQPLGETHQVRQLPTQAMQEGPLDLEGILVEVEASTQEVREAVDVNLTGNELLEEINQVARDIEWMNLELEIDQLIGMIEVGNRETDERMRKYWASQPQMNYAAFTSPQLGEMLPYDQMVKKMADTIGNTAVSVSGMVELESHDRRYRTQSITMDDGATVKVSDQAVKDWPRGDVYQVGGRPLNEGKTGDIQQGEIKGMVQRIRDQGVPDDQIEAVSTVMNQGLLNAIVLFLSFHFPMLNIEALSGGVVNLRRGGEGEDPTITGSAIYKISDMTDMQNPDKVRYLKVGILVDHPASAGPDEANIHYMFGNLQATPPESLHQ